VTSNKICFYIDRMASSFENRKWILHQRPKGQVQLSDFLLQTESLPQLQDGECLIKTLFVSFEPAQRGWMNDVPSYVPPIALGEVVRAPGVGEVIQSKNNNYAVGDKVWGMFGWQEYVVASESGFRNVTSTKGELFRVPEGVSLTAPLSVIGLIGYTAYFGFLEVGKPKEGDVVLVSAAAGATGSLVGQIAKIKGCRVIGIAGGADKCKLLKEQLGFDETIDYKSENVFQRIKELAPNGVNIYFDNVAGDILEAAISNMANFGTIVQCGGISAYNSTEPKGPKNYLMIVRKRLRVQGFIVFDFAKEYPRAAKELTQWVTEGKLKVVEDIKNGFENIPDTFFHLFTGGNTGKLLLKL